MARSASCPKTRPLALPRPQATSASICWLLPPAERQKKLAAGIANGRLAMMAIIGMFFQGGQTGSVWGDWAQYTGASASLACRPSFFWDPAGFAADGGVENFRCRRQTGLKHSRVSMLASDRLCVRLRGSRTAAS
jgi:hypothetical protein